ncbi:xylulose 5-phosphate 3-epimerase [Nitrosopumilus ureiphilus]|uniref:Xylulose 5-phosphate 3-epimerase n=2 Tax=Nitrosopumilus ureiphilus TaxID=1470067 RepID=A0A7D5R4J2_9ARCH|nr:xylulose 5-phosphate 3-epimerase [Nitrosopumilus ureiphilus]
MQGRLSKSDKGKIQAFPFNTWKQEFKKAWKCGFEVIEWIFDDFGNPILNPDRVLEIKSLCKISNIQINSICADYFMKRKLFYESENNISKNIEILKKIIIQSEKLGISIIEIPLVDSSSLKNNNDKFELKKNIEKIIYLLDETSVNIVLETDLSPHNFRDLLQEINHPKILANYDSGNSTSLGYNSEEELTILKKWIKNVHVKDRKIHGNTVPLGKGDTDFDLFFKSLEKIQYSGDLIIQGARKDEEIFSPEKTCIEYQKFVKGYLNKYYK